MDRTFSTQNAVDKYLIRLFTDELKRSRWKLSNRPSVGDVERLQLSTSPTFAAVVVEPTEHTPRVLTKRYCTTTRCRQLSLTPRLSQPVVVYSLSLTSRLRPRAAVFDTSATPRSPDTTSRPVDPSATASPPACRQRRQSCAGTTPPGYAAYFSCLLIFLNSCCIVTS